MGLFDSHAAREAYHEGRKKTDPNYGEASKQKMSSELKQKVSDKKTEGWEVKEIRDESVVMVKGKGATLGKHALVGILTGPFTFGAGNAAYHKYKKDVDVEKIVLRDDSEPDSVDTESGNSDPLQTLEKLNDLKSQGLITEDEFHEKKADVLDQM